ncbi:MAG: hypothetical protein LBH14_06015, partial [Desulfobulbaceae bacterium]|nr:hypothetical protein [Desulfobulbaceae bacterium]
GRKSRTAIGERRIAPLYGNEGRASIFFSNVVLFVIRDVIISIPFVFVSEVGRVGRSETHQSKLIAFGLS